MFVLYVLLNSIVYSLYCTMLELMCYLIGELEVPLVELDVDLRDAGVHRGANARLVVPQHHL
jgi:hypothetical protein